MVFDMSNNIVRVSKESVEIEGKKEILLVASLFYFRLPRATWEKRIVDLKRLGYNAVDVYFPWNFHENKKGDFDFAGEKDVRYFLQLLKKHSMYVVARPGPYICSEWNGGGIPARILASDELSIRTNDKRYLAEVDEWYNAIMPILARYEVGREGSVICVQIENELDFFDCFDVEGYISHLRDNARHNGITVPLVACAGQGSLERCGGLVDGVLGTYNFYPSFDNRDFDLNCYKYKSALENKDNPLLVTETHRDHYLLKRELLSGAKLLGAYNQVSGTNFEFYQSINNWGHGKHPESFITSDYDFGGVITAMGDYTAEADKAILFSCGLNAYGEHLACANSVMNDDVNIDAQFTTPVYNGILMMDNGMLVGVTNCGQCDGIAHITANGYQFDVEVARQSSVMLPVDVTLEDCKICYSNSELLKISDQWVIVSDANPDIVLETDGKLVKIDDHGSYLDGKLVVTTKSQALKMYKKMLDVTMNFDTERLTQDVDEAEICDIELGNLTDSLAFDVNNKDVFQKIYHVKGEKNKPLFVEQVADLTSVYSEDKFLFTKSTAGYDLLLPSNDSGKYTLKVEQWGYCNFDDPRRKALYLQAQKGVRNVFVVNNKEDLNTMRFQLYNEWLPKELNFVPSEFDALLSVNSWNSTRVPLIALYYTTVEKSNDEKIYFVLQDNVCESALYVDGKFVGEISENCNRIDITRYARGEGRLQLQILVRKREWTQPCGNPCVLYLNRAEVTVKDICGSDVANAMGEFVNTQLPLSIEDGRSKLVKVNFSNVPDVDLMGVVSGQNYKLTVALGGKIIARLVDPKQGDLEMQGGNALKFYIPLCWREEGQLTILAESVGKDCKFALSMQFNK